MSDEATSGGSGSKLPQTESLVPGSRESVGAVGGDDTVGDDVGVTVEGTLWVSVGGLITGQVPDDEGLVARTGEEHVWAVHR